MTAERFADAGRGITLCYERIGDPTGEPVLLVSGLGQQLHAWPDGFCAGLADRGYAVVRFDNRDTGRSTHMSYRPPSPIAMFLKRFGPRQYHLGDMARDAMGLLDALGIDSAHVVGMSMGGMIAQTLAAHAPWRVRSLVSIMSATGAPRVGRPALSTWLRMLGQAPATCGEAIDRELTMYRHIGSHGFPFDERWIRESAGRAWDRDPAPEGESRQLAAIFASGDRTRELSAVTAPTVVIHGDRDLMVHPTGGTATTSAIPGARLETITGMGHDLPRGAWPRILDLIDANARRAQPAPRPEQESADAEATA